MAQPSSSNSELPVFLELSLKLLDRTSATFYLFSWKSLLDRSPFPSRGNKPPLGFDVSFAISDRLGHFRGVDVASRRECTVGKRSQVRFPQYGPAPAANPWNPPINSGVAPTFSAGNASAPWPSTSGLRPAQLSAPRTISPLGTPTYPSNPSYGAVIRPNSSPVLPSTANSFPTMPRPAPAGISVHGSEPTRKCSLTPLRRNSLFEYLPLFVYPNAGPNCSVPRRYAHTTNLQPLFRVARPRDFVPNSIFSGNNWRMSNGWFNTTANGPLFNGGMPMPTRFFVTRALEHTWISGDNDPTSLGINDTTCRGLSDSRLPCFDTAALYRPFILASPLGRSSQRRRRPAVKSLQRFPRFRWETDPLAHSDSKREFA